MKDCFAFALGFVLALLPAAAFAAPADDATPLPAPPKPDFSPFAFLVGHWSCSSTQGASPESSISTSTWARDGSGYWLTSSGDVPGVKNYPYDAKTESRITYDPYAHIWIYEYYDDLGGYSFSTSPGWTGDTIVWTFRSLVATNDAPVSAYTIRKLGDAKYTGSFSLTSAKGTVAGSRDACAKR